MSESKRVSDHVVNTIAKTMAEAKAGNIATVAIITVSPDGQPTTLYGGSREMIPEVNLGADMLKATLMQQIIGAPGALVENSGLIRPN